MKTKTKRALIVAAAFVAIGMGAPHIGLGADKVTDEERSWCQSVDRDLAAARLPGRFHDCIREFETDED